MFISQDIKVFSLILVGEFYLKYSNIISADYAFNKISGLYFNEDFRIQQNCQIKTQ